MEKPRLPPIDYQTPANRRGQTLLRTLGEVALGGFITTMLFLILLWLFIAYFRVG